MNSVNLNTLYPEMIQRPDLPRGAWKIIPPPSGGAHGMVSIDTRKMAVSMDQTICERCGYCHAEQVRLHEMAHILFTPLGMQEHAVLKEGFTPELEGIVEDIRIRARLERAGYQLLDPQCIGPDVAPWYFSLIRGEANPTTGWFSGDSTLRQRASQILMAMSSSPADAQARHAFRQCRPTSIDSHREQRKLQEMIEMVDSTILTHPDPTSEQTLVCLRELDRIIGRLDASDCHNPRWEAQADESEKLVRMMGDPADNGGEYEDLDAGWLPMTVTELPLTQPVNISRKRVHSARDEGVNPVNIHRVATDQRLFRHRRKAPDLYSVLIDTSRSMRWPKEELAELFTNAHAASVAAYGGDMKTGFLTVIARGGKRASDDELHRLALSGSSNDCDGLALRWLKDQPGKLIWLSDGEVTGHSFEPYEKLLTAAAHTVCKYRIMRVESGKQLLDVLQGRTDWSPTPWNQAVRWT